MTKSIIIIILITLFIFFIIHQDLNILESFNQEIDYNKIYVNKCLNDNPYLKFDPDTETTSSTGNQVNVRGSENDGRGSSLNGTDSNTTLGKSSTNGGLDPNKKYTQQELDDLHWQIANCCSKKCITYPYCEKSHPFCKKVNCQYFAV